MAKTIYTLGEEGVKKFKQLTASKTGIGKRQQTTPKNGIDNYYPTPFQVQWAQSSGEQNPDGTYQGTYIIWLPFDIIKYNKIPINKYNTPTANNYPFDQEKGGWVDLKRMLEDENSGFDTWPDEFEIWMDYLSNIISFHFKDSDQQDFSRRILVARVKNKNVIQHLNSGLVINDTNKPFDIVNNLIGDTRKLQMIRNWFYDDDIFHTLPNETLPTHISGYYNIHLVKDLIINQTDNITSVDYKIEFTEGSNSEPEGLSSNDEFTKYRFSKKLYLMLGVTNVPIYDYRDAVVGFNAFCVDNTTISYGQYDGTHQGLLHFNNFYNTSADVGMMYDNDMVLIRRGKENDAKLGYATLAGLKEKLGDISSDNPTGVYVDQFSINDGTDGELSGILHLYNFHNDLGCTTTLANSHLVLRTPYSSPQLSASDISYKLEYMKYDTFEDIMDVMIDTRISDALKDDGAINNYVDNALSGFTPSSGGSSGMFAWDEKTRTIGAGGCMVGRQWYTASNTGSGKSDGLYSVVVTLNSSGSVFCGVVSNATLGQAPTDTQCWIPIYQITDGKIATDYRGAFVVPAYD